MSGETTSLTVKVSVDLANQTATFYSYGSSGSVSITESGDISVPYGECSLIFQRDGSSGDWSFGAIRLKKVVVGETLAFAYQGVSGNEISILDTNSNISGTDHEFEYQLQILDKESGNDFWVDPKIQNQSGMGPA